MQHMAALAANTLSHKYNVKIVLFRNDKIEYDTKCEILSLDIPSKPGILKVANLVKRAIKLRKLRKQYNPKAVMSFGTSANLANVFSKGHGETIISFRGYATTNKKGGGAISCYLADKIFCICQGLCDTLKEECSFAADKINLVYNGVDIENVKRKSEDEVIDFNPTSPCFVSVGRLEPVKGYRHLINSFYLLKQRIPQAKLVFIGDGSIREDLCEQVTKMELTDSVSFLGAQKNPFKYMKKCTAMVQTSITEGFMNVIVEAGACGLPVISVDCKFGPREILSDTNHKDIKDVEFAEYGILVPSFISNESEEPEKEIILANAMEHLVTHQDVLDNYTQQLSRRIDKFSVTRYTENLISLIEHE